MQRRHQELHQCTRCCLLPRGAALQATAATAVAPGVKLACSKRTQCPSLLRCACMMWLGLLAVHSTRLPPGVRQCKAVCPPAPSCCTVPTLMPAALQATPAPAVPPEVQRAYDKMTQCLYLLRRAHVGGRLSQPIKVLAGADLLNQAGVHFEDAVYETQGVARWLRYTEVWSLFTTFALDGEYSGWQRQGCLQGCGHGLQGSAVMGPLWRQRFTGQAACAALLMMHLSMCGPWSDELLRLS